MKNRRLKSLLKKFSDEKYRVFSAGLLPKSETLLGVRLPTLQKIANEILAGKFGEPKKFLEECESEFFEEDMLEGFVVARLNCATIEKKRRITQFVKKIKNWSVCDSFCSSLKNFAKQLEGEFFPFVLKFLGSKSEYECRFALVMLLKYALNETQIDKVFESISEVNPQKFYAQMALAWLIAEAYAKFPQKTLAFLDSGNLNEFTRKKVMQKIRDKGLSI